MRRVQAVVLILVLVFAPMALFAAAWHCACAPAYCTMAHCRCTSCPMMAHERDRGSGPAVQCDCMHFPVFGALAPLTEMILVRPLLLPGIVRTASNSRAVPLSVRPGFLPTPFHPPRG
jgi:hypothetical protein